MNVAYYKLKGEKGEKGIGNKCLMMLKFSVYPVLSNENWKQTLLIFPLGPGDMMAHLSVYYIHLFTFAALV